MDTSSTLISDDSRHDEFDSVDLSQFKGVGKYDYLLREGEHYIIVEASNAPITFRKLTDAGRNEFKKLIRRLGPPKELPDAVKKFLKERGIDNYPDTRSTMVFHFTSLVAQHPEYAFSRRDLADFSDAYMRWYAYHPTAFPRPRKSSDGGLGDVIQHVNKSSQWGLKHKTLRVKGEGRTTYYILREPYTFLPAARKLSMNVSLDPSNRAAAAQRTKNRLVAQYFTEPVDQWVQGHRHPNDESPSVWQPPALNTAFRDRLIFDEFGIPLCPTVKELERNFDKYYPEEDQRELASLLLQRFPEIALEIESQKT